VSVRPVCSGFASLVGAGPGDPELLTWRAILRLRAADLVLYDGLVPKPLAKLAAGAKHVSVAKRAGRKALTQAAISDRIVEAAWRGQRVVRLKAGDPYVLGRGGEEAAALARAGVPFEVVPGVSSAIAAPALAGIPLTHRGFASGFVVVSGHAEPAYTTVLGTLPPDAATVVILMGAGERSGIRRCLEGAGWSPRTPAAIITNASQPDQRAWIGTLATLDSSALVALAGDASVIVIGRVVSLATATHISLPFVSEETSWQPSTIQRR
jgi:uroporphyrin-III C-methyltransferase / precorrin-2 dehydrogenase / sirohydrochlorin ferrochelatase